MKTSPWLGDKRWAKPVIKASGKGTAIMVCLFALVWNGISWPLAWSEWPAIVAGDKQALIALVFPLVGAGMAAWAVYLTAQWCKFGETVFTMDPHPGAIGGDVGGRIDMGFAYRSGVRYQVTLACLYSYMSGSGKNRSRNERVVWQDSGIATSKPRAGGTHLSVRFQVPEGLPASEKPAGSYHLWRLSVTAALPGVDLSRAFDIPVFPTGERSRESLPLATEHQAVGEEALAGLESIAEVSQRGQGLHLYFPAGRRKAPALSAMLFGLIFSAVGLGLGFVDDVLWFFPLIFGGVGVLVLLVGIYTLVKALMVRFDADGIRTARLLFGVVVAKRFLPRKQFVRLRLDTTLTVGGRGRQVQYFVVRAEGDSTRLTVAERIRGRREAELMLESLLTLSGYDNAR